MAVAQVEAQRAVVADHVRFHRAARAAAPRLLPGGPAVCRRIGMRHLGTTARFMDTTSELFELPAPR